MRLIRRIEVNYLRSLYHAVLDEPGDLTLIFGRNDAGKSNVLRALDQFFNPKLADEARDDFGLDFSDIRRAEAVAAKGRQFISVRIDFSVPKNYQPSLGASVSVKRQWNIDGEMSETLPKNMSTGSKIQLRKFLNQIDFTYIPAIKDETVFADLIERMYSAAADSSGLTSASSEFVSAIRGETEQLSFALSKLFGVSTALAAPSDMGALFRSLDFSHGEDGHSLLRQKGDGVKARHLPELLRYINKREPYKYFIWGFEEPENSLDFGAAELEAANFSEISNSSDTQIFITSHSPAFYLADSQHVGHVVRRYFVSLQRKMAGSQKVDPKNAISNVDSLDEAESRMKEASLLQLPFVIRRWKEMKEQNDQLQKDGQRLLGQLADLKRPTLFVEGPHDKTIFELAAKRAGLAANDLSIRTLDGTPKTAAEIVPKLLEGGLVSDARTLLLFDNDSAGRAAYEALTKSKNPLAQPKLIAKQLGAWCLPWPAEFEAFRAKHVISMERAFFTVEFLFEANAAGKIYESLLDEAKLKVVSAELYQLYHTGMPQSASLPLRTALAGSDVWFWSRGVQDDLKGAFVDAAHKTLDLSIIDAVFSDALVWLKPPLDTAHPSRP